MSKNAGKDSGKLRRIVLTGFMGSGKSTVGPMVAQLLGWRFVDVDDAIVLETGMAISEFFARFSEASFRELERETIARLTQQDGMVIALGGGAIETAHTREMLMNRDGTLLIHLEVNLETTLRRCSGTEGSRPVLADRENLQTRYDKRLPLYRTAHVSIAVDHLEPADVAQAVAAAARQAGLPT